jgi:hypothetical protein
VAAASLASPPPIQPRAKNPKSGAGVQGELLKTHAGRQREDHEAADHDQADPVRNLHGQKIARGGKGHQGREQQQFDDFDHNAGSIDAGSLRDTPPHIKRHRIADRLAWFAAIEKPASRGRQALIDCDRRLFQSGRDRIEFRIERRAQGIDGGDDGNGDTGSDQAVFNGRGAGFVANET